MLRYYTLIGQTPVLANSVMEHIEWMASVDRATLIVKQENIGAKRISTVFLGFDLSLGDGPPLIFETAVFGDNVRTKIYARCSTWHDAEKQHGLAVKLVQENKI